jgi:Rad3-related DNA helicase
MKIYLNSMSSQDNRKLWMNHHDPQANTLLISPLTSKFHFEYFLRHTADKFIFMSATLDGKDRLCKEFGIDPSDMLYVDVPSQFDPGLSPVVHVPVGKMSSREIDTTLPEVVKACRRILQEHAGEKGLIHTTSYRVAQYIFDNLRDRRLLYARGDSMKKVTNEGILQRHRQSQDGVLLSPSMMTGVDLDEDEGRFQIVCKLPFESLGNPRTARKTKLDPEWYDLEMMKKLAQSCGRTTRSAEDSSISYILDSSFSFYFKKYRQKLPMWFQERVML